jgi:hypothetical protein
MKITEKDIGRRAKLRNGEVVIIAYIDPNGTFPVGVNHGDYYGYSCYTVHGRFIGDEEDHERDIVELPYQPLPHSETSNTVRLNDEDWPNSCAEEEDEELDERFVTKVPSVESNAIRLLKQLKRQGITELSIVADLGDGKRGEIRMEIYNYGKS